MAQTTEARKSFLQRQFGGPELFRNPTMNALAILAFIAVLSGMSGLGLSLVTHPGTPSQSALKVEPQQQEPAKEVPLPAEGRFPVLEHPSSEHAPSSLEISQLADVFDASKQLPNVKPGYLDTIIDADDHPRILLVMRDHLTISKQYIRICSNQHIYCLA